MNVRAASVHPKRDKEIHREQPKGFEKINSIHNKLFCKLKTQYVDWSTQPKVSIKIYQFF